MAESIDYGSHSADAAIDYGSHSPDNAQADPEQKGIGSRLWDSFVAALPHPINAIKEWANRPAEVGKAMDALHELNSLHDQAAKDPANKGKPANQWVYPQPSEDQQAKIDAGLTAHLSTPEDAAGVGAPLLRAGQQAQSGDFAGGAGTLLGAYVAPVAAGAAMSATSKLATSPGLRAAAGSILPTVAENVDIVHPLRVIPKVVNTAARAGAKAAAAAAEDDAFAAQQREISQRADALRKPAPETAQESSANSAPRTGSGRLLTPDEIAFNEAGVEDKPPMDVPHINPIQDALERAKIAYDAKQAAPASQVQAATPEPVAPSPDKTGAVSPSVSPAQTEFDARMNILKQRLEETGAVPSGYKWDAPNRSPRFDEGGPSETVKPAKVKVLKEISLDSKVAKSLEALQAAQELARELLKRK